MADDISARRSAREAALFGYGALGEASFKTAGDVGVWELIAMAGGVPGGRAAAKKAFGEIERTWLEGRVAGFEDQPFDVVVREVKKRRVLCMPRSEAERLVAALAGRLEAGLRRSPHVTRHEVAGHLSVASDDPEFVRLWAEVEAGVRSGECMPDARHGTFKVARVATDGGGTVGGILRSDLDRFLVLLGSRVRQGGVTRWCDRPEVAAKLGLLPDIGPFARAWTMVADAASEGRGLKRWKGGWRVRVAVVAGSGECVAFEDLQAFAEVSGLTARDLSNEWLSREQALGRTRRLYTSGPFQDAVFAAMWASMSMDVQCGRPPMLGGRPAKFERHAPGEDGWRLSIRDVPALVAKHRRVVSGATPVAARPTGRRDDGPARDPGEATPGASPR